MKNILVEAYSWLKTIAIALLIAILINAFLLQTYIVKGQSMEPTFEEQNRLIILKLPFDYDYGDIVVIDSRVHRLRTITDQLKENGLYLRLTGQESEHLWIKRIIGLPNDTIEIKDGVLYRNGEKIVEEYIKEDMYPTSYGPFVVPEDHYFVLGDNRNVSMDSRAIGAIPRQNIVGKVFTNK